MSDMIDGFKAMKDHKKELRAKFGVECPECKRHRPKACATILMPQQRCRVDGYRDPRPEVTDDQWSNQGVSATANFPTGSLGEEVAA